MHAGHGSPPVSVVMTAYNAESTITAAIRSLLKQSHRDFELIVVDDGSTDGTAREVRRFIDPRIRLLRNEGNLGISRSANRGIAAARAPLIARADADDIALPTRLTRQIRFLDRHPHVLALGTAMRRIDREGRPGRVVVLPKTDGELRLLTLWGAPIHNPTAMIRRRAFTEFGLEYRTDLAVGEDYDFWVRLLARGPIANLGSVECWYRTWDSSISSGSEERHLQAHLAIADGHAVRLFGSASPLRAELAWLVERWLRRGPVNAPMAARMARVLRGAIDAYVDRHRQAPRAALNRCAGEALLYALLKGNPHRRQAVRTLATASPALLVQGGLGHLARQFGHELLPSADRRGPARIAAAAPAGMVAATRPHSPRRGLHRRS